MAEAGHFLKNPPIPRPSNGFCDHCACGPWTLDGADNQENDLCADRRCPCHDVRFTTAIYEGATGEKLLATVTPRRRW
jgi:hypothetical protein